LNFFERFSKNTQIQDFLKVRPAEPNCCIQTGGRTDGRTDGVTYMMNLIVAFHNFANAPKTETLCNSRKLLDKTVHRKIFIFLVSSQRPYNR